MMLFPADIKLFQDLRERFGLRLQNREFWRWWNQRDIHEIRYHPTKLARAWSFAPKAIRH
jgi:hypothetical protein